MDGYHIPDSKTSSRPITATRSLLRPASASTTSSSLTLPTTPIAGRLTLLPVGFTGSFRGVRNREPSPRILPRAPGGRHGYPRLGRTLPPGGSDVLLPSLPH